MYRAPDSHEAIYCSIGKMVTSKEITEVVLKQEPPTAISVATSPAGMVGGVTLVTDGVQGAASRRRMLSMGLPSELWVNVLAASRMMDAVADC